MACPFCSWFTIPHKLHIYTSARHFLKLLDPRMLEMAQCPVKLHQKTHLYEALAGATSWEMAWLYELNLSFNMELIGNKFRVPFSFLLILLPLTCICSALFIKHSLILSWWECQLSQKHILGFTGTFIGTPGNCPIRVTNWNIMSVTNLFSTHQPCQTTVLLNTKHF